MSTEGWWIRASDGKAVEIHDHEIDIRNPVIAKRLGVPRAVFKEFKVHPIG